MYNSIAPEPRSRLTYSSIKQPTSIGTNHVGSGKTVQKLYLNMIQNTPCIDLGCTDVRLRIRLVFFYDSEFRMLLASFMQSLEYSSIFHAELRILQVYIFDA